MTPTLYAAVQRHNSGDASTAEALFQAALAENPNDAEAWQLLSAHLLMRDNFAASEVCARRATELVKSPVNWATLGLTLHRLQEYDGALDAHNRALSLDPEFGPALRNRAMTHYAMGDIDKALADCKSAREAIGEDDRSLIGDTAWITLASGNLKTGFQLAESRDVKPSMVWDFGVPLWRGESLKDKSILVHHEQGFGDTIMWARYLPQVTALAKNVTVAVHFGLLRLFRAQGWNAIVLPGEMPEVDFHCPFDSLAYVLGVSETSSEAYINPPPYKALLPINPFTKLRVGLVWSSGLQFVYGRNRSMPVENILPLTTVPGVQLYSLSPEGSKDLQAIGAGALVTDMAPMIRDFADTAAIIDKLDLVVSVDTAVLHLAGAMGKKAIGLMPFMPAWQWCPRKGSRATWYNSVELLWPGEPNSWSGMIRTVQHILSWGLPS